MSAATAPRRKQAKPQRLATTSSSNSEAESIPTKRSRTSPLSIEEQFQKQFSQSFEAHFLKAKQAIFDKSSEDSASLNIPDFLTNTDEDVESDSDAGKIKAISLLLPPADEAKNNFLLESLGTQQFLQLYNNALAQSASKAPSHTPDSDKNVNQNRQDTNSAATSCLLSPPNSSFNDIASSTASSSSNADRFACPLAECGQQFSNSALQMLHLSTEHSESRVLHCAVCDDRFGDLNGLRNHDCQTGEMLQRCASVKESQINEENLKKERARSEPPEQSWPEFRVENEKQETSEWSKSSIGIEGPPLLINESSANDSVMGNVFDLNPSGLKEMGLLAMRNHPNIQLSFHQPTFAPSIPNFVPPHASSGTPPRGNRQFTPEEDWEAMMEISTIDETEKIRALVGDNALPTTDPNQCLLCRRVLSCKSALQMHYRTHTGERPFKCKICSRSFTTKGNLKTHMGVHRSKHSSLRTMGHPGSSSLNSPTSSLNHQCPICQKRFISPQLLQQHVHEHTNQLTNRSSDLSSTPNFAQLFATNGSSDKKTPTSMIPQLTPPAGFPHLPFLPPNFMQFGNMMNPFLPSPAHFAQLMQQQKRREESEPTRSNEAEQSSLKHRSDLLASLGLPSFKIPRLESDTSVNESQLNEEEEEEQVSSTTTPQPQQSATPQDTTSCENGRISVTQTSQSPSVEHTSPTTSKQQIKADDNPLEAIQKMWAAAEQPSAPTRPPIPLSKHQCAVCYKHFSSSSALQIHTRTHTGQKPFKCDVCSRAFTTRGNLKVHMSTHSYQTSPSRRGRRIFDFGAESLLRAAQQGINPFGNSSQPNTPNATSGLGAPSFGFPQMVNNPAAMMSFQPFLAAMMASMNSEGNAKEEEHQTASQSIDPAIQAQMNAMMWMFKTVCTVCHKVCGSSAELQEHLKSHVEGSNAATVETKENSN